MTVSPIPPEAIGAAHATSRAAFRHLARAVGATNREADDTRHGLIGKGGNERQRARSVARLGTALTAIDRADPEGVLGAELRLAAWFLLAGLAPDAEPDHVRAAGLATAWPDSTETRPDAAAEIARIIGAAADLEPAPAAEPDAEVPLEASRVLAEAIPSPEN